MPVKITTNNNARIILDWIPEEAQADFDYIKWDDVKEGTASVSFVKYKGEYVDLNDTEGLLPGHPEWIYKSASYSFGWCFKYVQIDHDWYVVCGTYRTVD